MGRQHSADEWRLWSEQDPQGLVDTIKRRFSGSDAKQFRRCIRYLKTWRNRRFRQGGAPSSISLTIAVLRWFEPVYFDMLGAKPDDARALTKLVDAIRKQLSKDPRIELPVAPRCDLLEGLTNKQLENFQNKLQDLHSLLEHTIELPVDALDDAVELLDSTFR